MLSPICSLFVGSAFGQLVDETQVAPIVPGGTIGRALEEQIGPGRGDADTPQTSVYLIKRDPARAIRRGRQLFQRKFTTAQGLGPRVNPHSSGDIMLNPALGAGLVDSCAGCHGRPRGSAGHGGVVATRPDSRDAPHLFGLGLQEMLADEMTTELRGLRDAAILRAQERRGPVQVAMLTKGVSYGSIIVHPDGTVDNAGLRGIDEDLRVRPFFAQGGSYSIREFIVGAFNDEMGLQSPDPDMQTAANGGRVVTPSGLVLDGTVDSLNGPPTDDTTADPDGDGVANEIDTAAVDYLEFYLLNYFKPGKGKNAVQPVVEQRSGGKPTASGGGRSDRRPDGRASNARGGERRNDHGDLHGGRSTPVARVAEGRRLLTELRCTTCHIPDFTLNEDRRVADVETVYDPENGIFNRLFATASLRVEVQELEAGQEYPKMLPAGEEFVVRDIYTDFKRHDLGEAFWERQYDGTLVKEFITEPLWGAGTTAPYGHDGRSINLEEVILRHGGEAEGSKNRFAWASAADQLTVLEYLRSLVLFPPDDTASNLSAGSKDGNPQDPENHGSINLGALFQIPDPNGLGE